MGKLTNLNPSALIADADIPAEIARDSEVAAAVTAHVSALHPFPIFGFGENISTENVFNSGSGFLDCFGGGGIFPPNMGHIQGFQAKFNNAYGNWGMQLVTQNNIDNECYFRIVNWGDWKPWRRIWNDGNFNPANYLQISEADGRYRQSTVALTDADIPATIARDTEVATAVNAHVTSFHSLRSTLFSSVVAPVGSESVVSYSPIPFGKIVGVSCQMIENMGSQGMRFISKGGGGDFAPGAPLLHSGFVRVPAVSASQLVGIPLHIIIWHIP